MPIVGYGMTLHRIAAYLAAAALFSAGAIWPRAALARIHNCEQASLLPDDVGRLYWIADACCRRDTNSCQSGVGGLIAPLRGLTTARVSGENGVAQWWMASCSRSQLDV